MLALAADHGGLELKEKIKIFLDKNSIPYKDFGTFTSDSVDYPDITDPVCESIINGNAEYGIVVCGSGVGVSIRANRYKGIRAVVAYNEEITKLSRQHNNANVVCFGGRTIEHGLAIDLLDLFLKTDFEGGRHLKRIEKLDILEAN